jgi:hypothetical protein
MTGSTLPEDVLARIEGVRMSGLESPVFNKLLDGPRLVIRRWIRLQNGFLQGATGGRLGADLSDPIATRHMAEFVNAMTLTPGKPTIPSREFFERRIQPIPWVLRSVTNLLAIIPHTFRSQEDAIGTLNLGVVAVILYFLLKAVA